MGLYGLTARAPPTAMKFRELGRSGLQVSPLCFGGNVFGWTADQATSFRLLDAWVGAGMNFIDTADIYSRWVPGHTGGESETIIGKWLKQFGKRGREAVCVPADVAPAAAGHVQHARAGRDQGRPAPPPRGRGGQVVRVGHVAHLRHWRCRSLRRRRRRASGGPPRRARRAGRSRSHWRSTP